MDAQFWKLTSKYDHDSMTIVIFGGEVVKTMAAGKFKAQCLSVIDDVHDLKEEVIITKHGKPMAKLIPIRKGKDSLFGAMRGQIEILGDLPPRPALRAPPMSSFCRRHRIPRTRSRGGTRAPSPGP